MTGIDRRRAMAAGLGAWGAGALAQEPAWPADVAALREVVAARERAFAATMARRDLAAFGDFVSVEAVFLNGGEPITGREAIVRSWTPYFAGAVAPFAWEPDLVAVLASGRLAATTGPVLLPDGTNPMRFQSTWRREEDGAWRVVFDNGYRVCRCVEPPK